MNSLKNRFLGQDCVIFGNGPSLSLDLIEQIRRSIVYTFAVNGFCLMFDKSDFRPSFVCMSNYSAIQSYNKFYPPSVMKFYKAGWRGILPDDTECHDVIDLPFSCNHETGDHHAPFIKDGNFTVDPFHENFCGDTVILDFAIPLAYYMGFNTIILCGVDTDYSKGHFDKNYISISESEITKFKSMANGDYSIAVPGYIYSTKFLASRDRRIVKLTESKRLEFIETVDIEYLRHV